MIRKLDVFTPELTLEGNRCAEDVWGEGMDWMFAWLPSNWRVACIKCFVVFKAWKEKK